MHRLPLHFSRSVSSITQEISDLCTVSFHLGHESSRATQHSHTHTKLRGKPTDIETRVQVCSILEASRSIKFHSLPGRVCGVSLFNAHNSNVWLLVLSDLTSQRLHGKLQTRPLVREGAIQEEQQIVIKERIRIKSGHGSQRGARYQEELVDWLSAVR
jgi:hypothetical protein